MSYFFGHSSNHSTLGSVPSEPLVYAPEALKCYSPSDLGQTTSVFESKQIPAQLANSILSTEAEYTNVGFSGLRISNPVLGTLGIGDKRWMKWVMEEEEAAEILHVAYRKGINTWDTADAYSNGETESIIGRAIKKYNIPREKLVLMTKVGRIVADAECGASSDFVAFLDEAVKGSKDYVNQYGLSRKAILNAVERSLERLQTHYIDVLHIHRWDPDTPIEETMRTLHDLVTSGKVLYLAASSMWAFQFAMAQSTAERNGWTQFVAMQCHYNLIYREEEREVIRYCRQTGVGILSWAPLAEGYLARPINLSGQTIRSVDGSRFGNGSTVADKEIISRVQQLANKHGVAMCQVALAWLNKRVTSVVVGINSISRMEEVLGARKLKLTKEEEAYLESPYVPKNVQGHS
ncbi:NADP-dependent oxidoreductase domain-containing protein [Xylaria flabelliformis]|nr:NADP-dependent oxidoreductase domain-containing protein [Xylaria flabelliformis]